MKDIELKVFQKIFIEKYVNVGELINYIDIEDPQFARPISLAKTILYEMRNKNLIIHENGMISLSAIAIAKMRIQNGR